MRILVVDDHDALRKSMIDALSRQEDVALVDGAANGAEALKLLIQRRYDVIVAVQYIGNSRHTKENPTVVR